MVARAAFAPANLATDDGENKGDIEGTLVGEARERKPSRSIRFSCLANCTLLMGKTKLIIAVVLEYRIAPLWIGNHFQLLGDRVHEETCGAAASVDYRTELTSLIVLIDNFLPVRPLNLLDQTVVVVANNSPLFICRVYQFRQVDS